MTNRETLHNVCELDTGCRAHGDRVVYDYCGRWGWEVVGPPMTRCGALSHTLFSGSLSLRLRIDLFHSGRVFSIQHRLNKHLLIVIVILSPVLNFRQAKQDGLIKKSRHLRWGICNR